MKRLAILMNMAVLIGFVYIIIDEGLPEQPLWLAIVGFAILTPIVSIVCLLLLTGSSETWLALYFQRKRLEEKAKIEELKGDKH